MTRRIYLILLLAVACLTQAAAGRVVKLLAIGNSFSEDAVEQYLYDLAAADGQQLVIGNMYIPGCPLDRHVDNMRRDARAYRYRKVGADGRMTQTDSMQLSRALTDEAWDYVSVQQVSQLSGIYESYQPYLHQLVSYIRRLAPQARIVMHQTWAYARSSTHGGFAHYGNDQMRMYRSIVEASRRAARAEGIRIIVPAGTAIQNARTSVLGDTMNRDGYHLHLLYGRYTAACTWYARLFGRRVTGNGFAPEGMTPVQVRLSQKAAQLAVRHPWRVSTVR